MKIISVADEDTNTMLGLIGIEGKVIKADTTSEFEERFDEIIEDKNIGLILINEHYLMEHKDYFKPLKIQKSPLILEIPDLKEPISAEEFQEIIVKYLGVAI